MIIKTELKTYGELDDFLLEGENWKLFIDVFGYNPSNTNIKRKLKTNKNWTTDVEIIEKMLETLPDKYIVGEWGTSWENSSYAMQSCSIIWVQKVIEE